MASKKSKCPDAERPRKRTACLAQIAFERLRRAILTGELKEGERVRESRLAADWNMGLTPLREAVRRMAAIGYLVLQPNRAPVVRKLSGDDIRQVYELRKLLEGFALRSNCKAIGRDDLMALRKLAAKADAATTTKGRLQIQFALDTKLHQLWTFRCGNPWLTDSLERLLIYRPNLMNLLVDHRDLVERAFEEHKQILAALEKQNIEKAVQLLGAHIQKSGTALSALSK